MNKNEEMYMIDIVLPRHREILDSGECKVVALNNSHIEGYFMKGDTLQVVGIVGSMLKVKNEKGYVSLVNVDRVLLIHDFIEKVHCDSCGSLDEGKHMWTCEKVS